MNTFLKQHMVQHSANTTYLMVTCDCSIRVAVVLEYIESASSLLTESKGCGTLTVAQTLLRILMSEYFKVRLDVTFYEDNASKN